MANLNVLHAITSVYKIYPPPPPSLSTQVSAFAIFIGSLGDQADRLARRLPSGKGFVCLDTKKIPETLKTIFTSTMLK